MARADLHDRIQAERRLRTALGRAGAPAPVERRDGTRVQVGGRWLAGFSGHDYLGLAQQFEVAAALQDTAAREGVGAGGTPAAGIRHALHVQLEREIADWLEYPAALLFADAYLANLAVQQALLGEEGDVCVHDRLNRPSLFDATRLAGCRLRRYPHRDPEGALRQLELAGTGAALLASEGVFAIDGEIAPLRALTLAGQMQRALVYVDDAHGIGVLGPQGRGSVADAGLGVAQVPLLGIALDTALGGAGAVVVGESALIEHLAETARPWLLGGAPALPMAAAMRVAVRLARRDDWRRERLAERIAGFRRHAQRLGLRTAAGDTPIQLLAFGDEARPDAIAAQLDEAGYRVTAMRPPAVPEGHARLRITLSALHTEEQVAGLAEAIARVRDRLPLAAAG
ncbi:aminotransferase class I/II-fold pyridoxal phosphate-dependent enzyme [Xanthomonas massiliensis]|uniref:aminotransferase class I/II-fold pyridoxal phosphate-dependent enzyme n=1 Tax=Xanthomonas massiliensis TaxID=1720302 RepID=UPI000825F673|nr:aminotransferase class I/II-fold pyridoxal phosphate-dependent enzyme [Xanthomonas massiliensis]